MEILNFAFAELYTKEFSYRTNIPEIPTHIDQHTHTHPTIYTHIHKYLFQQILVLEIYDGPLSTFCIFLKVPLAIEIQFYKSI